jgi:hypothetical protein
MPESVRTVLVGEQHEGRLDRAKNLRSGERLWAVREPDNEYDTNAVALYSAFGQVGYLPVAQAAMIAPVMDEGGGIEVEVTGRDHVVSGDLVRLEVTWGHDVAPQPPRPSAPA